MPSRASLDRRRRPSGPAGRRRQRIPRVTHASKNAAFGSPAVPVDGSCWAGLTAIAARITTSWRPASASAAAHAHARPHASSVVQRREVQPGPPPEPSTAMLSSASAPVHVRSRRRRRSTSHGDDQTVAFGAADLEDEPSAMSAWRPVGLGGVDRRWSAVARRPGAGRRGRSRETAEPAAATGHAQIQSIRRRNDGRRDRDDDHERVTSQKPPASPPANAARPRSSRRSRRPRRSRPGSPSPR